MSKISGLVAILFFVVYCYLSNKQINAVKTTKDKHGQYSMMGTAMVGSALFVFRLIRGFRSWLVKYVHMSLALGACFFLYKGQDEIKNIKSATNDDGLLFKNIHMVPGYVLYGMVTAHILFAILIFLCVKSHRARFSFSALHDIFGVWLFTQLTGCCMAGMQSADPANTKVNYTRTTRQFNEVTVSNFILTTFVVLNPFFEWDMIEYI